MELVDGKILDAKIEVASLQKKDWLEATAKSYENNVKIAGLIYNIKDYNKLLRPAKRGWRNDILYRAFVETKVVAEDVLFEKNAHGKRELKRVVRDAHPLGNSHGAAIIVAFTESWLANDIKEIVRNEALRALRARRDLINSSGGSKKYILHETLRSPWITLVELDGETKTPIPFKLEDGRLQDPAKTLAIYTLNGVAGVREFKPFRIASAAEKALIQPGLAAISPPKIQTDDTEANRMN